MPRPKKYRLLTFSLYLLLAAGIVWQVSRLYTSWQQRDSGESSIDYQVVTISGNVDHPGSYKVASGTTRFEILKAAGVRLTSDLSPLMLYGQIDPGERIEVGATSKPVALKEQPILPVLEFFLGDLNIISADGRSKPQQEGLDIEEGDRFQTEDRGQAEVSLGAFSRIDLDKFAELVFTKINASENGKNLFAQEQRAGVCWYNLVYRNKNDLFQVTTAMGNISIGGNGANFVVEVTSNTVNVHLLDGLLLIEKGSEAINLISGQSATIFNDARPIGVTRLAKDVNPSENFSQLVKEKTNFMLRNMPLNILFCGVPPVFHFFSVQYENGNVVAVSLPPETSVEQFVQGFSTLGEAFLYGGPVFVSSLVERILNARASKYTVFEKQDIVRTVAAIGGLTVSVDDKAASVLKVKRGVQKLNSAALLGYMKPSISGIDDSQRRQKEVLSALFSGIRGGNVVITALLADQIVSNIETNFTSTELMKEYAKFNQRKTWTYKSRALPVQIIKTGGQNVCDPILDKCRELLYKQD